jgi:membrane-bound lytic murein transglycosylase D
LALSALPVWAQEEEVDLEELVRTGEAWMQENVDLDAWSALPDADQKRVEEFWRDLQRQLAGEYVVDLAPLRQTAELVLSLLEGQDTTQPYAAWLKARRDYFEVADEFRLTIPPPAVEPGLPPKPIPNPSPATERKVWVRQLEKRPLPSGAGAYVTRLKPLFTAQRVPGELVWVAEVESAFDPRARSPAGAVGLFQLMPDTARQYGLALRPRDERFQAEKSATAAAQHLRHLHERFRDWPLALAAYNAGEGRVQRLLQRHQARSFDAIAVHLPAETQLYVPKIEATLARREGVSLSGLGVSRP